MEHGRAFFHESASGLAVIFGPPRLDLMPRLEIKKLAKRPALRGIEILLHQTKCDPRSLGEPSRQRHRRLRELIVGHRLIDNAQRNSPLRVKFARGVVELARLTSANELRKELRPTEVAGKAHPGERCDKSCRLRGDP